MGGGTTRSRMDSVLDGPGATAEDVEVVFGSESQRFDVVTDLTHQSTHTTGHVLARGVLRDNARAIFKGMIRISEGAKNSRSEEHTSELQSHSDLVCRLLLEKKKKKT